MTQSRICYLEIPAVNPEQSATFYHEVFGWNVRRRSADDISFDDAGMVSGRFVTDRPPHTELGIAIFIMVDNAEATVAAVEAAGGKITRPLGYAAPEIAALFADPAGNILGIYQEPEE
ncbi:VOC family protein [Plantactinospora sp. WMMC1484]|uniref:VOC family protein n=1 Tax=Plantactinospora sp. WMMC1484 TaxID=3404122 RepID=UPI003BF53FE1